MRLHDWLEREGRGATARLARAVGTRWATIYDIANGHVPKADLAKKIAAATGDEVPAGELLGIEPSTVTTIDAPSTTGLLSSDEAAQ